MALCFVAPPVPGCVDRDNLFRVVGRSESGEIDCLGGRGRCRPCGLYVV